MSVTLPSNVTLRSILAATGYSTDAATMDKSLDTIIEGGGGGGGTTGIDPSKIVYMSTTLQDPDTDGYIDTGEYAQTPDINTRQHMDVARTYIIAIPKNSSIRGVLKVYTTTGEDLMYNIPDSNGPFVVELSNRQIPDIVHWSWDPVKQVDYDEGTVAILSIICVKE